MDRTIWVKAQAIFHEVAESRADEQQALLERLCKGEKALMSQVAEMLEEDKKQEGLLDASIATLAEALLDDESTRQWRHVEQIGPYRLIRELGQGGMGIVYLAERSDIGGLVAIKLLRDAWVSPARRQRFALEQRTLAQLNYPAIAKIYDANTLPDGTPWFVMEYVDGISLTTYWESHRESVEECLHLFRAVCEAVLYAHRRAIIHRDLKPSNILVTAEGAIKLLDFGIAKHLDENESIHELTLAGIRPMTPAYAAPEQYSGGSVGVFTDVYALGVLLYQMLTGDLPFGDGNSAVYSQRSVPRRPSFLVAKGRFNVLPRRGEWNELSIICQTAMRVEPERRYQSVEAMIRDVDAFLNQRPLEAKTDSWTYRFQKFIIRRRLQLAYTVGTAIVLAGLIGYFTYRLREARDEALAETARTERIQQFTTNLFRGNESSVGPADDLRVKTLLDRGREEANNLSGDPDMQADMRETLGEIYRKLGDQKQAETLLAASLERRRTQKQQNPGKYAKILIELGQLRADEGRLDEAEGLIRQGLQMSRSLSPNQEDKTRPIATSAMVALGTVLEAKGDYPQAATILESALQTRPRSSAPDADMALNLRELANVHFYQGHYTVADTLDRQVLAIHHVLYGERHPEVAEDLNDLGAIQFERGNLSQAEELYRQSVAVTEAWYGPQHPKTAEDLTSLARALIREQKYRDARPLLERALNIQQNAHGHDHLTVASALNELGTMEKLQEDYRQAELHFAEALAIWRKIYGHAHQFIGVGLSNLGSVYMSEKKYAQAERMYREALQVFIETVHEDHLNTGIARIKLGRSLLRQRRFAEAEKETLQGYQILVKVVAPSNIFLKAAEADLVQIYMALNRIEDANRFRKN